MGAYESQVICDVAGAAGEAPAATQTIGNPTPVRRAGSSPAASGSRRPVGCGSPPTAQAGAASGGLATELAAGEHVAAWGGPGAARVAAGLHFARIETPGGIARRRLVITPGARQR
jgi:hypothetical protein